MRPELVTAWMEVARVAARQHGVISLEQLLAVGLHERAVRRAAATGRLHRVHRGVYAVGHVPRVWPAAWMAGVLACGPEALLSHRSAAVLWRVREGEAVRVDVTIPPGSGRRREGIAIHRLDVPAEHRTEREGIPVVSPEWACATSRTCAAIPCVRCTKASTTG